MRLWSYTSRELGRRPGRTLLTLTGIVLGVAAIVAVTVVSSSTRQAYRDMFAAVSGKAALEVVASGQSGFDPSLADTVGQVSGVDAVVPVVQVPAALLTDAGRTVVIGLGVDPAHDAVARSYDLDAGATAAGHAGRAVPTRPRPQAPRPPARRRQSPSCSTPRSPGLRVSRWAAGRGYSPPRVPWRPRSSVCSGRRAPRPSTAAPWSSSPWRTPGSSSRWKAR